MNFGPGIWLISLFETIEFDAKDCSGDYHRSFVYMFIAQLNYFVIPFVLLCLFNMLILLNIWKRTKKISRFKSIQINEQRILSKRTFLNESSPIFHGKCSTNLEQQIPQSTRKSFKFFLLLLPH